MNRRFSDEPLRQTRNVTDGKLCGRAEPYRLLEEAYERCITPDRENELVLITGHSGGEFS